MRGVLFIGAKNVDSSFDSFLASSKPPTALNALGNPLLDPLSLNKLSVLAEVDDEDTAGSSATSSPQCTIDPIAIAAATTEVITSAIPVTKLKGKGDADKGPDNYPRKASSYQPPSLLAHLQNPISTTPKPQGTDMDYVRPKRVSTSTGHQRPQLADDVSAVPLSMAQSGFIPPTALDKAIATFAANGGANAHPLTANGVPVRTGGAFATDGARSTPGTSSIGSNNRSRRSRTSSVSEEARNIPMMSTSPGGTIISKMLGTSNLQNSAPSTIAEDTTQVSAVAAEERPADETVSSSPSKSTSISSTSTSKDHTHTFTVLTVGTAASQATDNTQGALTTSENSAPSLALSQAIAAPPPSDHVTLTLSTQATTQASQSKVETPAPHADASLAPVAVEAPAPAAGQNSESSPAHAAAHVAATPSNASPSSINTSQYDSDFERLDAIEMSEAESEMTDEYSDDDDVGYARIHSTSSIVRQSLSSLSVFIADDSSDSSDDATSSGLEDESSSDVSGFWSDDDVVPTKLTSTACRTKRSSISKRKSSQGSGSTPSKSSTGDGTVFMMDDEMKEPRPNPSKKKRLTDMELWTLRPLSPAPCLKVPAWPDARPKKQEGGLDFSIVNLKKSRHEKDVYLEYFHMKIIYDKQKTGFEATHDFPIRIGDVVAGRYEIVEYLGSAAFSRAVKCIDHSTNTTVCLKIIKNNKDYFDQSLDEIKLLTLIKHACQNRCDDFHVLEIFDYFYFKEHLFIVCELLRENLYEVYKYNRQSGDTIYFNIPRLQRVAWQALIALNFIHKKNLIHCDLKPENILIKSYSKSLIKVIDFGSSCFTSDQLSSYVQSRSYRAPEVVLGYSYDQRIDMWSLGCILAELWTGRVLFQNESLATLIAKHVGIVGLTKAERRYLKQAPLADDIFTTDGVIFEKKASPNGSPSSLDYIQIKQTSLRKRLQTSDRLFLSFVQSLLHINPVDRPTSWQALHHPWFRHVYPDP